MREKNIFHVLRDSRYTVVLSGAGLMAESGYPLLRDGEESYEIEDKYGYFCCASCNGRCYSARGEQFFTCYKEGLLKWSCSAAGKGCSVGKKRQEDGLVRSIVTRRIAGLEDRVGCRNVVNMKGTVFDNVCPSCGRHYPMEYVRDSKGVPLCEHCLVALRPQVCLFGEMIDNGIMTRAAGEVEKAEVLLVLGASLNSPLCSQMLQYYSGTNLILVTGSEHYADQRADFVVYGRCDEFLERLAAECDN